jgi:hypothetical protein
MATIEDIPARFIQSGNKDDFTLWLSAQEVTAEVKHELAALFTNETGKVLCGDQIHAAVNSSFTIK